MGTLLWSVTIPTYNASVFIEETLRSVLLDDPGEDKMEIVVVDNCSTDNTVELVENIGKGRIKIVINERNLGAYGNFNKCVEVANGELIHLLNADDLVKPGFYTRFETAFQQHPDVHLVCCNSEFITNSNEPLGTTATVKTLLQPSNDVSELLYMNCFFTPAVVVRKSAYDKLGSFDTQFAFVADWEMWARVIYNLKGLYLSDVLAKYRVHSQSDSAQLTALGNTIPDFEKIYSKFILLGYPINPEKANEQLRLLSSRNYIMYYYAGNKVAAENMLALYRRHATLWDSVLLLSKTRIRKILGSIKRRVLVAAS